MKTGFFLILILFLSLNINAQKSSDDIRMYDDFQELSEDNIFKTEGYFNWGASIIKGDDGKYHLFYARWEKKYSFYGWLTHSEVAQSTAKSPAGPGK